MTERPIIFSGPMIRAILDGTKRQTRRVFKEAKPNWRLMTPEEWMAATPNRPAIGGYPKPPKFPALMWDGRGGVAYASPYGVPGDRLWVRETGWERPERTRRMMLEGADTWEPYYYDADGLDEQDHEQFKSWGFKRRPAIFMPRLASRITLEVVSVRVERLQEISEDDAIAEGLQGNVDANRGDKSAAIRAFRAVWDSINAKRGYGWEANPFVWVLHFNVKNHI